MKGINKLVLVSIGSLVTGEKAQGLELGIADQLTSSNYFKILRVDARTKFQTKILEEGRKRKAKTGKENEKYFECQLGSKEFIQVKANETEKRCKLEVNGKRMLEIDVGKVGTIVIPSGKIKVPSVHNQLGSTIIIQESCELIADNFITPADSDERWLYGTYDCTPEMITGANVTLAEGAYTEVGSTANTKYISGDYDSYGMARRQNRGYQGLFRHTYLNEKARSDDDTVINLSGWTNKGWIVGINRNSTTKLINHVKPSYGPKKAFFFNHSEGLIDTAGKTEIQAIIDPTGNLKNDAQCIPAAHFVNRGVITIGGGKIIAITDFLNKFCYTRWDNQESGVININGESEIGIIYKEGTAGTVVNNGKLYINSGRTKILGETIINNKHMEIKGELAGNIVLGEWGTITAFQKKGLHEISQSELTETEKKDSDEVIQASKAQSIKYFRHEGNAKGSGITGSVTDLDGNALSPTEVNEAPDPYLHDSSKPQYVIVKDADTGEATKFEDVNDINDLIFIGKGAVLTIDPNADIIGIQANFLSEKIAISDDTEKESLPIVELNGGKEFTMHSYNQNFFGYLDVQNRGSLTIDKGSLPSGIIRVGEDSTLTISIGTLNEENCPTFELDKNATLRITGLKENTKFNAKINGKYGSRFIFDSLLDGITYGDMLGVTGLTSDFN